MKKILEALCVVVLAPMFATIVHAQKQATPPQQTTAVPTAKVSAAQSRPTFRLQAGDRCLGDPKFLENLQLSKRAVVDTTQVSPVGMSVVDVNEKGQPGRRVHHQSWAMGGYLGAVQRDAEGNIFVYPAPSFTIEKNPPEKSNILYRVDSKTGVMAAFAEIEKPAPANTQNPYGIVATAYDCATHNIYVSSVFGSTPGKANGAISMVNTTNRKATIVLPSLDTFSLTVAHFPDGRRLLYANAREPMVLSRSIREDGQLGDDERVEIQLDEWASLGDRKARRLRIDPQGRLLARVQPFDFTLSASSVIARAELVFEYDAAAARFKMLSAKETPTSIGYPTAQ